MKIKDLKDIRTKEMKEIRNLIGKKKIELLELMVKIKSGGEKNLKKVKNLRKDIAQILTIKREKELTEKETEMEKEKSQKNKSVKKTK
jgi:ribosomal protein L29